MTYPPTKIPLINAKKVHDTNWSELQKKKKKKKKTLSILHIILIYWSKS